MPFGFSARPVQIATGSVSPAIASATALPPHAPCKLQLAFRASLLISSSLPPHAPCKLQRIRRRYVHHAHPLPPHAPCKLQRVFPRSNGRTRWLCLHTLRANCNEMKYVVLDMERTLPPHAPCKLQPYAGMEVSMPCFFASTRSVQIATAEMHRMQYALFRTCVESVDSFSVLNKSMLR